MSKKYFANYVDGEIELSLCSMDVQVGDKAIDKTDFTSVIINKEYWSFVQYIGKEEDFFKVIGQISPEATWVKEGDEFDLDDLLALEHPSLSVRKPITHIRAKFIGTAEIYVKGPCGHFH